ncbi:hypothetical protein OBBRIDRAFT_731772 [Obba rivulosa]|uniref:C2H2-type domain-containing protein n=1 Tax=Obba rivulosa TaxID=1052685 RepID=A0A8E2AX45_9APHY|nr:hypothetical protein OBBRIDRAFT_731772 [Obba rivulosa]
MPVERTQRKHFAFHPRNIPCTVLGCLRAFKRAGDLKRHLAAAHSGAPGTPNTNTMPHEAPWIHTDLPDDHVDVEIMEEHEDDADEAQPPTLGPRTEYHPELDGCPCDADGNFLAPNAPLPDATPHCNPADAYAPYDSRAEFELADFFFRKEQMSAGRLNQLMELWAATLPPDQDLPFANADDLYNSIDSIPFGDVPWQSFTVSYSGKQPEGLEAPSWMTTEYEVWFRCPREVLHQQLGNPDFAQEMDYAPKRTFDKANKRVYQDFMSGNWAWKQADIISEDTDTHGATFCPVILGSDKTTVSVATGQNEYYPLYLSNGLVSNAVRRAQRNAVSVIAFLSIPKTDREGDDSVEFRKFRRQLFHASLRHILSVLRPSIKKPEIVHFGDGHYRKVIYGLGPYIADYPEQVLLACVVQGWCPRCTANPRNLDGDVTATRRSHEHTNALRATFNVKTLWDDYGIVGDLDPFTTAFPRADIHELLSPDLLHQVIKGTFKDHLVSWVEDYLVLTHGKTEAAAIMADIDRRIALVPSFPGLRRFPQGRGFKQWTGDDSKALMKVWLPAIVGHVPSQMVRAISAFMEFCYLVRRSVLDEDTLAAADKALKRFHNERVIFKTSGVRPDGFSLPRQHALSHYRHLIQEFGAPNGLCSSITESKHIKAVKEPWRRSNRYNALGQMLLTNQRLDKLGSAHVNFTSQGLLNGPCTRTALLLDEVPAEPPPSDYVRARADEDDKDDEDVAEIDGPEFLGEVVLAKCRARGYPSRLEELANYIGVQDLPSLIQYFLFDQLNQDPTISSASVALENCPPPPARVSVYPSAVATFYAPSDLSGVGGMRRECIWAVHAWKGGAPRRDCAFVEDTNAPGFRGLRVVRVLHFLSFKHGDINYPCALVTWFTPLDNKPCPDTGMWIVTPDLDENGEREMSILHIDCFLRGAHLIAVMAEGEYIPRRLRHSDTLDIFDVFYVNKYADHHAHEIAW